MIQRLIGLLPNELLTDVVNSLNLGDTLAFAQTSQGMYSVSQSALRRHKKYKSKYSTIQLGLPDIGFPFETFHPFLFLGEILNDPSITDYVTDLQISQYGSEPGLGYAGETEKSSGPVGANLRALLSTRGPEIESLSTKCSWIDKAKQGEWRSALTQTTNQPHHMAILLTMLRNLRSIKMLRICHGCVPINDIIWKVAATNRDPLSRSYHKALSALASISIDHWETKNGQNIQICNTFIALPSLRFLHGHMIYGSCKSGTDISSDEHNDTAATSYIKEISMKCSAIDAPSFVKILQPIKNLERFTYEHVPSIIGDAQYDPIGIIANLLKYASHSLNRLELTYNPIYGDSEQYIGDLRGFQVLHELRVRDAAFEEASEGEIVRMVEILPASIRSVTLLKHLRDDEDIRIFKGLAKGRDKVPGLKRIYLEEHYIWGNFMLPQALVDTCLEVGIEICGPA